MSGKNPENKLQPRYITFGYSLRVSDIIEWLDFEPLDSLQNGIGVLAAHEQKIGRMLHKTRTHFSYQVYQGKIILIGGCLTNGELLKTTEIIDCNGIRGSSAKVESNKDKFPYLDRKRSQH